VVTVKYFVAYMFVNIRSENVAISHIYCIISYSRTNAFKVI
jgi:hypothetical protein